MKIFKKSVLRKILKKEGSREFLLKKMPKNSICCEIGVHLGGFSEKILKIVKPKRLHLIDPWRFEKDPVYENSLYGTKNTQKILDDRYNMVLKKFKNQIESNQVIIHRNDSSVLENFDDEYFDWVYIDGNHLYEFVRNDLKWAIQKIKATGFITGDDYGLKGWWNDGVKKAVDEFVDNKILKIIEIKNNQYILKKY